MAALCGGPPGAAMLEELLIVALLLCAIILFRRQPAAAGWHGAVQRFLLRLPAPLRPRRRPPDLKVSTDDADASPSSGGCASHSQREASIGRRAASGAVRPPPGAQQQAGRGNNDASQPLVPTGPLPFSGVPGLSNWEGGLVKSSMTIPQEDPEAPRPVTFGAALQARHAHASPPPTQQRAGGSKATTPATGDPSPSSGKGARPVGGPLLHHAQQADATQPATPLSSQKLPSSPQVDSPLRNVPGSQDRSISAQVQLFDPEQDARLKHIEHLNHLAVLQEQMRSRTLDTIRRLELEQEQVLTERWGRRGARDSQVEQHMQSLARMREELFAQQQNQLAACINLQQQQHAILSELLAGNPTPTAESVRAGADEEYAASLGAPPAATRRPTAGALSTRARAPQIVIPAGSGLPPHHPMSRRSGGVTPPDESKDLRSQSSAQSQMGSPAADTGHSLSPNQRTNGSGTGISPGAAQSGRGPALQVSVGPAPRPIAVQPWLVSGPDAAYLPRVVPCVDADNCPLASPFLPSCKVSFADFTGGGAVAVSAPAPAPAPATPVLPAGSAPAPAPAAAAESRRASADAAAASPPAAAAGGSGAAPSLPSPLPRSPPRPPRSSPASSPPASRRDSGGDGGGCATGSERYESGATAPVAEEKRGAGGGGEISPVDGQRQPADGNFTDALSAVEAVPQPSPHRRLWHPGETNSPSHASLARRQSASSLAAEGLEASVSREHSFRRRDSRTGELLGRGESLRRHSLMSMRRAQSTSSPRGKPFRWRRGAEIGTGACGSVHIALNEDTGQMMAVKNVTLQIGDKRKQEKRLAALKSEIEMMKNLTHENIVAYIGTERGQGAASLNIFMEYVAGGSVHSLIKQFGALSECVARGYTGQLLVGLGFLHEHKACHRDIKGANILLTVDGKLKLADFGASTYVEARGEAILQKSVIGTPNWMPPEVVNENGHGLSADIWSLGCTVMEMVTGEAPWWHVTAQPLGVLNYVLKIAGGHDHCPELRKAMQKRGLSEDCVDFMVQCLRLNPSERPTVPQLREHPWVKVADTPAESTSGSECNSPLHGSWQEEHLKKRAEHLASIGKAPPAGPLSTAALACTEATQGAPPSDAPRPPPTPGSGLSGVPSPTLRTPRGSGLYARDGTAATASWEKSLQQTVAQCPDTPPPAALPPPGPVAIECAAAALQESPHSQHRGSVSSAESAINIVAQRTLSGIVEVESLQAPGYQRAASSHTATSDQLGSGSPVILRVVSEGGTLESSQTVNTQKGIQKIIPLNSPGSTAGSISQTLSFRRDSRRDSNTSGGAVSAGLPTSRRQSEEETRRSSVSRASAPRPPLVTPTLVDSTPPVIPSGESTAAQQTPAAAAPGAARRSASAGTPPCGLAPLTSEDGYRTDEATDVPGVPPPHAPAPQHGAGDRQEADGPPHSGTTVRSASTGSVSRRHSVPRHGSLVSESDSIKQETSAAGGQCQMVSPTLPHIRRSTFDRHSCPTPQAACRLLGSGATADSDFAISAPSPMSPATPPPGRLLHLHMRTDSILSAASASPSDYPAPRLRVFCSAHSDCGGLPGTAPSPACERDVCAKTFGTPGAAVSSPARSVGSD